MGTQQNTHLNTFVSQISRKNTDESLLSKGSQITRQNFVKKSENYKDYQNIVNDDRLLKALAYEFQEQGKLEANNNSGLVMQPARQKKKTKAQQVKKEEESDEDYRGSLSSIRKMSVQPGVTCREFSTGPGEVENDNPCFIKSGGVYGFNQQNSEVSGSSKAGQVARKMSIKEYQKSRGVRSYDMTKDVAIKQQNTVLVEAKEL